MNQKSSIKKIPYGISDYGLIRPRRFGKTLLIALMQAYFDIACKDRFEELFKGTWIYDHPTSEQGKYLVLAFNFSTLAPDPDAVQW